jgi:hypothetical protein
LDSRLVQDIRGTDGLSGAGLLSKVWDFNMEESVSEFRDDLRAASGIGRRSAKVLLCLAIIQTENSLITPSY